MIRGVTDRERLPRLGKIRLGKTKVSRKGKAYPEASDHFVFDDVPELAELFGDNCRELWPVILPAEDEETFFPTSLSAYGKSGLFCRCSDGETATRVYRKEDAHGNAWLKSVGQVCEEGEFFEMPCVAEDCPYFQKGFCKRLGRLFLIIPHAPRFGVYEIATSSINSIRNILSVTRAVRSMIGRVAGVPFALKLQPLQVQPGGRAKTVFVLHLECRASLAQLASIGRRLQSGGGALALIEAPDEVPTDLYPHGGAALEAGLSAETRQKPRSLDDLKSRIEGQEAPAETVAEPAQATVVPPAPAPAPEEAPQPEPEPVAATTEAAPQPAASEPVQDELIDF